MAKRKRAPSKTNSGADQPAVGERASASAALTTDRTDWREVLRRPDVVCLLLALVTLVVFWPAGHCDFVNYDDADYVTANKHVLGGLTWDNVAWAFTTGHASNWHPLTWLSHMLDCQLFGPGPVAMHRVNCGFHVLNAVFLFLVLRRLTGAHWRSAMVAALFALHPLHVESVAWVAERKDVLSGLFFLLTLWAYARYVAKPTHDTQPATCSHAPTLFYALTFVLYALGLMSKPMLVTAPFLLLLLDYWPLRRVAELGGQEQASVAPALPNAKPRSWKWLLIEKLPFFVLAAASSVITFIVQRKGGAVSTSLPLGGRLANAAVSYARYLGKVFWPAGLSVLYPHPGYWPVWAVIGATVLLIVIFTLVVWQWRRRPYLAVGWLWFFGGLVPVIGLVQVGIQSMADRYTYIPSIGLFLAVVWGVNELAAGRSGQKEQTAGQGSAALGISAALVLTVCAVLTARQLGFWQNSETLFRHAVQVTPRNYLAYNNLGYYLSNLGRSAEAMDYYAKSLAINPNYEDALNNMGYALAGRKKYQEAIGYYQKALQIQPNQVEVHNNLGNAFSDTGRLNDAVNEYLFVLKHKPEHADAHNNLGIALAMQGKLDEAMAHFRDAIRYKTNYASAHSNLGNALAVQQKFEEARLEYLESLRLNPADAQAHNNLGNVLAELGRVDEAIPHYREALRLNTDNPEAHFNLGVALERRGQRPEAVAHLNEALRLKPDYAEARKQLESLTKTGSE